MGDAIEFTLNGCQRRITGCSPNTTLLEFLRGDGLTGSKEGCAEGDCGACSVVVIDRDAQGRPAYRAINSCLVPMALLAGRDIISVEGVAGREGLHPVQKQMVECHGSQCGYCTPGFIMSLFEGFYRGDLDRPGQLDDQLCGNLCRCTGYRAIREAALRALAQRSSGNGADPLALRLSEAPPELSNVAYAAGAENFLRPTSLPELLRLMRLYPEGRLVAGATELGLEITKRYRRFRTLISLEAVPELRALQATDTEWRIGAAVTLTVIEEAIGAEFPALSDMLRVFGSRQIRNRATMGGNLVTASPIGDCAPALLALDAQVVLVSVGTEGAPLCERVLPLADFFVGYRKTALRPGEILQTILVPRNRATNGVRRHCEWYKVSRRREMDISTVAACFAVELDETGVVRHARLAFGGVAALPARARKTEEALLGKPWTRQTVEAILPGLRREFTPLSDVRGTAEYRQALITRLVEKFHRQTAEPEPGQGSRTPLPEWPPPRKGSPPLPHESARRHVTGEALYVDDLAGRNQLEVWPVCSPHARARILRRDTTIARSVSGVRAVLLAEDVPGVNDAGTKHDEPLLPAGEVSYHGQIVALVVGDSLEVCRAAAEKVEIDYEPWPPILNLEAAVAAGSFHNRPNFIRRGDCGAALAGAPLVVSGSFEIGGQEHFYLETHAAIAQPGEDGSVRISSSTQHPSEVQAVVAQMLGVSAAQVVVECPRLGGGFGGKETQAALPAALAALAARVTGYPVRVRFNRDQDMAITGHRHPFLARFKAGVDRRGKILAAQVQLYSNGGWALDLSQAVTDRALFHLDNAYYLPAVEFSGQVARTNLSSNTAFRGFGGPQGMLVIEEILDRVARELGLPPETVRERNLYHGSGRTNTTHYGQEIGDQRLERIWRDLKRSSSFGRRRKEIAVWNRTHAQAKRGLAITPVKFGISFTVTHLNQAGALVLIYQDGTVQVNHGGTEMGQGLQTNIGIIAARALGVRLDQLRLMPTSTDKVPNTSATAASCGTDLNGGAVQNACEILRQRLAPCAADLLAEKLGRRPAPDKLVFDGGFVHAPRRSRVTVPFETVVRHAYLSRVSLSATGYFRTPGIHWDRVAGRGRPFHYFACGAAVTEVEVDGFTGMHQVLRVDILHDAGDSINEGVNRGQVEGGFVQGMGWLTTEELKWDDQGRLLTHSPDTYKLPAVGDVPWIFNVALLTRATQKGVIHGSKAVGEPPFMLAISVREALRDAISAFGPPGGPVRLASPATSEAIFRAIGERRKPHAA